MLNTVNLADKCALLEAPWAPAVVGALNGQLVKVARFEGEYVWHRHEQEDELFLVVRGRIRILLRGDGSADRALSLGPGEFAIIPRGVEHKPVADEPADVMLFEPDTTRSTGDVDHALSLEPDELRRL